MSTTSTTVTGAAPDMTNYYLIHEAMRRGSVALADAFAGLDPRDRRRVRALAWMATGIVRELHAHHGIEDDLFFPALAARVPSFAELDPQLTVDHERLDEIMTALTSAAHGLVAGVDAVSHHPAAVAASADLAALLDGHLRTEDDDVLPLFARHFDAEEYEALDRQAIKRTGVRQLLFTVPWAATSVDPADAARLLREGPGVIRAIWQVTRRGYARRASVALGVDVPAVVR